MWHMSTHDFELNTMCVCLSIVYLLSIEQTVLFDCIKYLKKNFCFGYLHGCVDANGYSSVGSRAGCGPAGCIDGGQW